MMLVAGAKRLALSGSYGSNSSYRWVIHTSRRCDQHIVFRLLGSQMGFGDAFRTSSVLNVSDDRQVFGTPLT